MTTSNNGGPAFPLPSVALPNGTEWGYNGMSLRDWFAGIVLSQGLWEATQRTDSWDERKKFTASLAYEIADAMLLEREKKPC